MLYFQHCRYTSQHHYTSRLEAMAIAMVDFAEPDTSGKLATAVEVLAAGSAKSAGGFPTHELAAQALRCVAFGSLIPQYVPDHFNDHRECACDCTDPRRTPDDPFAKVAR
jgi:hypothetical protein